MSYNNTVALISNAEFMVQDIKSMLVLLRDIDKIECYDYFDAEEYIKKALPNVIILHSTENDKNCLKLLKKIRQDNATKDIPVILYPEFASTDYIVEAFDSGVTDILSSPLKDYELVIRVIWAIQKSEAALINRTRNNFLSKLGIIDNKTGFYKEEFSLKFLESVIAQAKANKQKSCLIMLKAQPAIDVESDKEFFMRSLKNSVRLNDTIAIKDDNTCYIFLSKAKLNGVYSVYERILSRLGPMTAITASVVEIQDELFDDIINVLDFSINRAPKNGEIAIVQKQDFLEMYKKEEKEELGIAKLLKDEDIEEEILEEEPVVLKESKEETSPIEEDTVSLGLKIMKEKVKEIKQNKEELIKKTKEEKQAEEDKEIDERNAILYKQSFAKKLTMVVEPLLKKYAAKFQNDYKLLDANIDITPHISFMKFDKDDIKLNFEMVYDGLKTIRFNLAIFALGTEIESDSLEMEVMEFDYQKLDIILKTITEEYKNYLSEN